MEFKPAALDLRAFARRLVEEVLSVTNRRCPIELSLSEMLAEIQADERLLRHIFTNLLTNAIKYSEVGRVVRFEVGRTETEIACVVRDEGIGIPATDREWLFTPHFLSSELSRGFSQILTPYCLCSRSGKLSRE